MRGKKSSKARNCRAELKRSTWDGFYSQIGQKLILFTISPIFIQFLDSQTSLFLFQRQIQKLTEVIEYPTPGCFGKPEVFPCDIVSLVECTALYWQRQMIWAKIHDSGIPTRCKGIFSAFHQFSVNVGHHITKQSWIYYVRIIDRFFCTVTPKYPSYHSRRARTATTGGSLGWCLLKLH